MYCFNKPWLTRFTRVAVTGRNTEQNKNVKSHSVLPVGWVLSFRVDYPTFDPQLTFLKQRFEHALPLTFLVSRWRQWCRWTGLPSTSKVKFLATFLLPSYIDTLSSSAHKVAGMFVRLLVSICLLVGQRAQGE